MKSWQRYWLYLILIFFTFHLIRDIFQDLHIHSLISDIFVKGNPSDTPVWYWKVFNTYLIEIGQILLATISLKRDAFGWIGWLTILITVIFSLVWSVYWFLL